MPKILLIESDRILADAVTKILAKNGHKVDWHVDPQAATNSADKKAPELIIIDLMLGGRSGVEFLYEFRSYPEWQKLPVIVYSNIKPEEFSGGSSALTELGIAAYHYKPTTSLSQLVGSVENILKTVRVPVPLDSKR